MAGHSKFANIKHRKNAQDAKRAKLFTKLTREIMVAAGTGQPDPDFNPRLRNALISARKAGVPKDRIETAIKKGSGEIEGEHYDEIRYEGYANGGIALIVETLTDNKNRTVSEVRSTLTKAGGSLAETGSVSFLFERVGLIEYPVSVADEETMFEVAAELGAANVESSDEWHVITSDVDSFSDLRDGLIEKYGDPETSRLDWQAKDLIEIDDLDKAQSLLNLIDTLEDLDDVQYVSGNYDITDEIVEKLEG